MEPGDMADLPQQGIDDIELRPHKPLAIDAGDELERARARILEDAGQVIGPEPVSHSAFPSP